MASHPCRRKTWQPFICGPHCCAPDATYPDGWAGNCLRVASRTIPIWSCSRRGLPCRSRYRVARWALTPPFHPHPASGSVDICGRSAGGAVCFLWHFPWGRPRRQLTGAVFPWSPDFPPRKAERLPGRLAVRIKADVARNARPVRHAHKPVTSMLASGAHVPLHLGAVVSRDRVHALCAMAGIVFEDRPAGRTTTEFVRHAKIFHAVADIGFRVE